MRLIGRFLIIWMLLANLQFLARAVAPPPANDDFANATVLTEQNGSFQVDLTNATEEPGEPFAWRCGPEHTVWYKFIPTHFCEFNAGTPAKFEVFKGTELGNLTTVESFSTTGGFRIAYLNKAEVYYIQVHICYLDLFLTQFSYSFKSLPGPQTVTFPQPPDVPFSSEPILLQAMADSGLPVQFSVSQGNATINGNVLTARSAGTITISAWQPGNWDFQGSPVVSRTFKVLESPQSLPRPVNDESSNATDLGSAKAVTIKGTTLGATQELWEPRDSNAVAAVWFKWKPATSGGAQFQVRDGTPLIFVYQPYPVPEGFQGVPWAEISRNNNPFFAQADETYYIAVYAAAEPGPFHIEAYISGPNNDEFADAQLIHESNGFVEVTGTFWGATREPGEPAMGGGEGSIWYRWIPEQSGRLYYTWSPLGSGEIPDIWVFHAKGDSLDQLELVSNPSSRPFLIAGERYYLAITRSNGPIRFLIGFTPFRPYNDYFVMADGPGLQVVPPTGEMYRIQGTTSGATREPDEPPGPAEGSSVWYILTPIMGGHYNISTSFGDLAVFEPKGPTIKDLEYIGGGAFTYQTPTLIYLKPRHTYYIAVYPHGGFGGDFYLDVSRYGSFSAGTDNFADASPLDFGYAGVANSVTLTASTSFEPGESISPGSTGSNWYKFRVPFAARVRLRATEGNATLRIYQGDSVANLADVTDQVLDPEVLYHLSVSTSEAQTIFFDATLIPPDFPGPLETFNNALPPGRYVNSWMADPRNIIYWEPWTFEGRFGSKEEGPEFDLMAAPASATRQIVLEPGKLYDLSFAYSSSGRTHVRVLLDGAELLTVQADYSWGDWPSTNITFRAASALSTIRFENLEAGVTLWEPTLHCLEDSRNVQMGPFNSWTTRMEYTSDPFPLYSNSGITFNLSVEGPASISGNTLLFNGTGTVTVHASQPGDIDTLPGRDVTRTFYVTKKRQSITFDPLGPVAETMTLSASASSGLPVSFEIVSGPATLSGNVLYFNGPGAVLVRAVQRGNNVIEEAPPVARSIVYQKLNQTIEFNEHAAASALPRSKFADRLTAYSVDDSPDLIYLQPRASSRLPVSLSVVSGPAHLLDKILAIDGVGQIIVRATQSGNDEYYPATVEKVLASKKAPQTIQFDFIPDVSVAIGSLALYATSSSGLPVSFTLLGGNAGLSGSVLTLTGGGTITIRASQPGNDQFDAALAVDRTFEVTRLSQTISFSDLPPLHAGGSPAQLVATASSGLPVTFQLVSGTGLLNGDSLTADAAGALVIRATQAGNNSYLPASVAREFTVISRTAQSITFADTPPPHVGDAPRKLLATASSGLPVIFQLVSGPAQLAGDTLTITSAGSIVVRAIQTGNDIYLPATLDREFIVASKAGQSIQFEALPNVPVTTTSLTLHATASSGLPVTFTLVSGNATFSGATLAINGFGQITIRASQAGNDQFDAAPSVERSFEVTRLAQTISLAEIPSLHFGDAAEKLTAIASSGLPVVLQLLSGPAELTGDLLKPISTGSVTIRASQSGDDTWSPAPDIERTLIIAKALQTLTFPLPAERLVPDGRIRLTATASSGLPVAFRVLSGPGEFSDDVLYANGLGDIIVEASQSGDANYEGASLQQTISVLGSPELSVSLSSGKLILTWPDNNRAFQLESASVLDGPWSSFTLADPSQNQAEITTDTDSRFFRLKSN